MVKQGLYRTMASGRPVTPTGEPLPWFTYPAIHYLEQLDLSSTSVFEYGSGNSTLWWQTRVAAVRSVEHDAEWYQLVRGAVHEFVDHRLVTDAESYVNAIAPGQYDIIVIDGEFRRECVRKAVDHLKSGGFIVLDNSDWFPSCAASLRQRGLIEVDFAGFGPINDYTSVTSIFLHPDFRPQPVGSMPQLPRGGVPENVERF